jgi:lysophospholipase L1-like esterase
MLRIATLIVFILLLPCSVLQGQTTANQFENAYNPAFANFVNQLKNFKKNKQKKVTILHLGDSHIQCDIFTDKVRTHFQQQFGDGGRGLVFPYKVANSTNPHNFVSFSTGEWTAYSSVKTNLFSRWGLTGYTLATNNPQATLALQTSWSKNSPITKVKIFYPIKDYSLFDVSLLIPKSQIKVKNVYPEDGFVEYEFRQAQRTIPLTFSNSLPIQKQFLLQGISLENHQKGVIYHAVGVNGADIETFLRCTDLNPHLKTLQPDLVIISLGTNDALVPNFDEKLFKINYKLLIRQIQTALPKAAILLTSPNPSYDFTKKPNKHLEKVQKILKELKNELNCTLWDFYGIVGGIKSIKTFENDGWLKPDKIHLTNKGYTQQGELFWECFRKVLHTKK